MAFELANHNDLFNLDFTNSVLGTKIVLGKDGQPADQNQGEPPIAFKSDLKGVLIKPLEFFYRFNTVQIRESRPERIKQDPMKPVPILPTASPLLRNGINPAFSERPLSTAEIDIDAAKSECISGTMVASFFGKIPAFSSLWYGPRRSFQIAANDHSVTDITIEGPVSNEETGCVARIKITQYEINGK